MKQSESVIFILSALETSGIEYMVGGSVAYMNYAIPRATKDFDLVIQIHEPEFTEFLGAVAPSFDLDPQIYVESLTGTKRYILQHRKTAFDVELFIRSEDPHHLEMWGRKFRRRLVFCNYEAWIPTAEDMIIQKLRWGRPQDLVDVDNMITIQSPNLDWPYIEHWCDQHGTRPLLEQIRASLPPLD
ncbi:Nucleotidyl transferase of unknown function [Prosthecobacter debontii]|uniref:DUF6036 domain-containing protein n=1 Tax=Prosthecobacter debontii TaxID=48467 RepID=A0A1T4WR77_9BACT|nr:nucleotidyltransferase [Prosthecobacter debontii]SKA79816.1 Nucleotidyl transferase of unknown function [Prosthecobacter debontii]